MPEFFSMSNGQSFESNPKVGGIEKNQGVARFSCSVFRIYIRIWYTLCIPALGLKIENSGLL